MQFARSEGVGRMTARRARAAGVSLGVLFAAAFGAQQAQASEGGASFYLLGTGGPGAAMVPPLEGVFLVNTLYHYDGKAGGDRQFLVGGNLVAGLKANVNAVEHASVAVPPAARSADPTSTSRRSSPVREAIH